MDWHERIAVFVIVVVVRLAATTFFFPGTVVMHLDMRSAPVP